MINLQNHFLTHRAHTYDRMYICKKCSEGCNTCTYFFLLENLKSFEREKTVFGFKLSS